MHVWLVEDNRKHAEAQAELLKRAGITVTVFYSAEEAIAAADHGHVPHIVISDLDLPGMNGYQFALWCKKHHVLGMVPLVAITGTDERTARTAARDFGFVYFLTKPLDDDPEALGEQLLRLVSKEVLDELRHSVLLGRLRISDQNQVEIKQTLVEHTRQLEKGEQRFTVLEKTMGDGLEEVRKTTAAGVANVQNTVADLSTKYDSNNASINSIVRKTRKEQGEYHQVHHTRTIKQLQIGVAYIVFAIFVAALIIPTWYSFLDRGVPLAQTAPQKQNGVR